MARSDYIYILSDAAGPFAAFTHEHELATYLYLHYEPQILGLIGMRLQDGTPIALDQMDLLDLPKIRDDGRRLAEASAALVRTRYWPSA